MFPRHHLRWRTRFGEWVNRYTVSRIVSELHGEPNLSITPRTVYGWLSGHSPHPDRAMALTKIAGGELSLEDIYGHRAELERLARVKRAERQ